MKRHPKQKEIRAAEERGAEAQATIDAILDGRITIPRIALDGPLSPDEVVKYVTQLCEKLTLSEQYSDRSRAWMALGLVISFIFQVDGSGRLARPLIKLWDALADLEYGVVASMLKPARRSGNPDSGKRSCVKVHAAVAMSLLMKPGRGKISRKDAATRVAALLRRAGMKFGRTDTEAWITVNGWRNEAVAAAKGESFFGAAYRGFLKAKLPLPQGIQEREQVCRAALEMLLHTARSDET